MAGPQEQAKEPKLLKADSNSSSKRDGRTAFPNITRGGTERNGDRHIVRVEGVFHPAFREPMGAAHSGPKIRERIGILPLRIGWVILEITIDSHFCPGIKSGRPAGRPGKLGADIAGERGRVWQMIAANADPL